MFVYVRDELDVFEGELESYITSVNQTGTLTPVILQVKELMSVTKGKNHPATFVENVWETGRGTYNWWQVRTWDNYCHGTATTCMRCLVWETSDICLVGD